MHLTIVNGALDFIRKSYFSFSSSGFNKMDTEDPFLFDTGEGGKGWCL